MNAEIEKMKTEVEEKRRYKAVANRDYRIVEEGQSRNVGEFIQTSGETQVVGKSRNDDGLAGAGTGVNKAGVQELGRVNVEYRSELPRPSDGGTPTTVRLLKQAAQPMSVGNSHPQSGYNTTQ